METERRGEGESLVERDKEWMERERGEFEIQ